MSTDPAALLALVTADRDGLRSQLREMQVVAAAQRDALHRMKVDTAIADALRSGRICPAQVDGMRKLCGTAEGLDTFRGMMAVAPAVHAPLFVEASHPAVDADTASSSALTPQQRKMARDFGLSDAEYAAALEPAKPSDDR